jgi:hypothetical protein
MPECFYAGLLFSNQLIRTGGSKMMLNAQQWVEEEYPLIAKEAKRLRAEIWFADESGLRSDYHAGASRGLKGKTPVVRSTGARHRLNMLSVVNR